MFSKILCLCSIIFLLATGITADPVWVVTPNSQKTIETQTFEGFTYISTTELIKIADGERAPSSLKRKESVKMWNKVFVLTLLSQYMVCEGQTYNLILPTKYENNNLYVPFKSFFKIASDIVGTESSFADDTLFIGIKRDAVSDNNDAAIYKKEKKDKYVIVIDPGHGGKDPGAIGPNKTYEKDIVLSVGLKLKKLLEKSGKWEVILTRSKDVFISLGERARIANEAKADLFVSIHCNGSEKSKARGSECYYLSPAKNDEGRATAALENSSLLLEEDPIVTSIDEVEFMLADMLQNEFLRESSHLAVIIQDGFEKKAPFPARKVNYAPFYVLYNAFMPSVLVEMAFITNKEDEKLLKKDDVQDKLASTIKEGLEKFRTEFLDIE